MPVYSNRPPTRLPVPRPDVAIPDLSANSTIRTRNPLKIGPASSPPSPHPDSPSQPLEPAEHTPPDHAQPDTPTIIETPRSRTQRLRSRKQRLRLLARARRMKGVKRGIDFRRFWLSLLRGRFELARTTIDDLLRCYRPQQLYLRLFVPTLSLSGTMFALGRINYHDEHRVTWGCLRLMRYVRSRMPLPSPNGLSALATGVGQDSHRIGLRMVCDLMESVGWNVHFLSTNERGTLRHAIQQYRPDALLLSIGRREEFDQAKRMIGEARRTGFTGVIAVGGRAVASEPNALSILGADLTAANGLDLARKITLWSRSRRHQPAPEPAHPLTRQSA